MYLRELENQQKLPLSLANPQRLAPSLVKWLAQGLGVEELTPVFDEGWLATLLVDALLDKSKWVAEHYRDDVNFPLWQRLVAKPLLSSWAKPTYKVDWITRLPQETYGRRALADVMLKLQIEAAFDDYYVQNPTEAAKRERFASGWVVRLYEPGEQERRLLGWRPGDDWRSVAKRQLTRLEGEVTS